MLNQIFFSFSADDQELITVPEVTAAPSASDVTESLAALVFLTKYYMFNNIFNQILYV